LSIGILHCLVLIVRLIIVVTESGQLLSNLNLLALQQAMNYIANLAIARAVVGRIAVFVLRL
jgi:hypothetical protein